MSPPVRVRQPARGLEDDPLHARQHDEGVVHEGKIQHPVNDPEETERILLDLQLVTALIADVGLGGKGVTG